MNGAVLCLLLLAAPSPAQQLTRTALPAPCVVPALVLSAPLLNHGPAVLTPLLTAPAGLALSLTPSVVPIAAAPAPQTIEGEKAFTAGPAETAEPASIESAAAASADRFDNTSGRAGFFFNDHDASSIYGPELKAFVARHDSVMVEMLKGGHDLALFQRVSDGKLTPSQALRRLKNKSEPLNKAVLQALHHSGKRVLPESIYLPPHASDRHDIDSDLMPEASALLEEAYIRFTEDGEAVAAAESMRRFNAVMVKVHAEREEAIVADLKDRLTSGENVGVMLGMFHTWPYQQLQRQGLKVSREFHPRPEHGSLRMGPHVQSLRRLRFGKPPASAAQDLREELGFLILHFFLDPRFRAERSGEKSRVETAILGRMKQKDFEALAEELSAYAGEHNDLEIGDKRLGGQVARWLVGRGFMKADEKRFFRLR